MSLEIGISGTNFNRSYDVESMHNRLTAMRNQLSRALDASGGNNAILQDRLNKVDSQINRLDRLSGNGPIEVSAQAAMREIEKGMRYLQEGIDALNGPASQLPGAERMAGKLGSWFDHLSNTHRQIDLRA
jgi:hypothetical protein